MSKSIVLAFIIGTIVTTVSIVAWFNLNTVTENRVVGKFKAVTVNGPIQVFLMKDMDDNNIRLEADKGLLSILSTQVKEEELVIQPTTDIRHERVLKEYLSSRRIKKLKILGSSTVEVVNKIESDTLEISLNQGAEARILADCRYIKVTLNGASNIFMAGRVDNLNIGLSGFSDVVAYKLESKNCSLSIQAPEQSEGVIRVSVSDTLRVSMNALHSRVVYNKGDPVIIASNEIMKRIIKKY
jgi:hypothetical protein